MNKIWPWKEILTWRTNSEGIQVPLKQMSVSLTSHNGDVQLTPTIMLSIVGFTLLLEKLTAEKE